MTQDSGGIEVMEGPGQEGGGDLRLKEAPLGGGSDGARLQRESGRAARWDLDEPVVSLAAADEARPARKPGADEQVVPISEAKQLCSRVRELESQLGKKTLEAEILKEALEPTPSKKLRLRSN